MAYSSAASVSGQDDPCTSSAPRPEDDKEYSLTDDGTKMQMDRDNSINEKVIIFSTNDSNFQNCVGVYFTKGSTAVGHKK